MDLIPPARKLLDAPLCAGKTRAVQGVIEIQTHWVPPLSARSARVVRSEFRAKPGDNGTMTFKTTAKFDAGRREPPRLGLRGTGQIYGQSVPLVVYLLRRPISALRQIFGL